MMNTNSLNLQAFDGTGNREAKRGRMTRKEKESLDLNNPIREVSQTGTAVAAGSLLRLPKAYYIINREPYRASYFSATLQDFRL
jgi:hypothetical protein